MKNRLSTPLALALFVAVVLVPAVCSADAAVTAEGAKAAAGSNFVSGNANNDGQYTPRKVRQRRSDDPNRAPGFWDKEWKRSGLSETIGKAKWRPFSGAGKFLKEKEEAYKAKRAGAASMTSTGTAIK